VTQEHFHFLILAGGGGTRLWPASRKQRPKQFLPLLPGGPGGPGAGDAGEARRTLLGATVGRLLEVAPAERLWVVTAAAQLDEVRRCAPEVPRANLILEPEARNTAPCVGLAAVEVARRDPEAVLAVIPSDQYVGRSAPYHQALLRALGAAASAARPVVTIGIRPTHPETGFGYLEVGKEALPGVRAVERFVEKPDRATAEGYLAAGRYLWNSGMFFFSAARIREALAEHLPTLDALLVEIERDPQRAPALYPKAPKISIDYGVMERLPKGAVVCVPGDFDWSDVGSFAALGELAAGDERGNVAVGEALTVDAERNILYSQGARIVTAVGVSDLIIVATDDAVLVLPRARAQDVREIVAALERERRGSYL
jgi:mannose-1-phosphate guanylyltransferase